MDLAVSSADGGEIGGARFASVVAAAGIGVGVAARGAGGGGGGLVLFGEPACAGAVVLLTGPSNVWTSPKLLAS
jgi:hypothetical protein